MKPYSLLTLILILLSSCVGKSSSEPRTVAVSVAPQAWFVDQISGGSLSTQVMVPPGSNPELYDPAPRDIAQLEQAALYIYLGTLPYESRWLGVVRSDGPQLINLADSVPHDMIHTHVDEHGHIHPHGDPHFWSSYGGGLAIAEVTYNALSAAFPEMQDTFTENYTRLVAKIKAAQTDAHHFFATQPDSVAFVIYHPSLTQFSSELGLIQLVIEQDGKSPTPKHLAQLIDTARARSARVVLIQQEYDSRSAENVAQELGIPSLQINPHHPDWLEEMTRLTNALKSTPSVK